MGMLTIAWSNEKRVFNRAETSLNVKLREGALHITGLCFLSKSALADAGHQDLPWKIAVGTNSKSVAHVDMCKNVLRLITSSSNTTNHWVIEAEA